MKALADVRRRNITRVKSRAWRRGEQSDSKAFMGMYQQARELVLLSLEV